MYEKMKKELSLIFIMMLAALSLGGCSQSINATINANASGSYEETATIDKDLWDTAISGIIDEEMFYAYYRALYPAATISVSDKTVGGTACKVFHFKMSFQDMAQLQQVLSGTKPQSIHFNKNYFSKSDVYIPFEESQEEEEMPDGFAEELEQLLSSVDEATGKKLVASMQQMDVAMAVSFPYTVSDTNGTVQEDGKTVVWDSNNLEKERLYALFQVSNSLSAPKYQGAVNGAAYNTGVSIDIQSENLLRTVKVNGETVNSDCLFLSGEDAYQIIATDINGNTSRLRFRIDKTKPVITGAKDGKSYKTARTIRFSDKGSGIKKALLNGKAIKTGTKISKKGTYTLDLTDNAGNQKIITFKIK
ncbi:MAG: hypothetical protein K2N87_03025 [Eubacterium sp.]|nr:hypothetical protein [Eubacterium sp.]